MRQLRAFLIGCLLFLPRPAPADFDALAFTAIASPDPSTDPPAPLADDGCLDEIRRCCGCPSWRRYLVFDTLFLQRNNQVGDQSIFVESAAPTVPVLTAQALQPATAPGVRMFYGELVTDSWGWEIGYTGIYGMFGEAAATGDDLQMPNPLGSTIVAFDDSHSAEATYFSTLNMAELNLFRYRCCEDCDRCCRRNCHCVSWLAGFIWAGLDEQASLTTLCCDPPEPSTYSVRSTTNFFGGQVGMWGRREWRRWAVEGWWKTALCGTSASQSSPAIIGSSGAIARDPQSATTAGMGFIGGLNGTLVYRLTETWGLRAGYNLYWLYGAALAPNQWDFSVGSTAGTGINTNAGLFLHGANLGLERRW